MRHILKRRPSPALVIAVLALFVAMGGTGYAAIRVTSANVRDGSLTGADIRINGVTGRDLKDIKGADLRNYSLTGRDVRRDSLGQVPIKEEALKASKLGKVRFAQNADRLGGLAATAFERSGGILRWSKTVPENGTVVLASSWQFDVVAVCDSDSSLPAKAFGFDSAGTAIGIRNRSVGGSDNGFADTSADDESDFDRGEAVGFNYKNNGHGGSAFLPNGRYVMLPGFANAAVDASYSGNSFTGCHFSGVAFAG